MTTAIENRITAEIVRALEKIKRPDYRSNLFVRTGITAADLDSSNRPLACVQIMGHDDMPHAMGRRHEITLDVVIYVETADVEKAHEELVDVIDDIGIVLRTAELLPTADVPAGLLSQIMWMKGTKRIVDPSGQAGIGCAEVTIEAKYRLTHA